MALIQMNFLSTALQRTVPVTVILPVDNTAITNPKPVFPTLYLLHGLFGSHIDWTANTRIQQWAEARGLAVVMPSGDNSFYIDHQLPNQEYGRFIGQELVEMTRRAFPISREREKTFLAGLSMGGFGAIRNGLKYADTFGYVAGFSSAVHIFELPPDAPNRTLIREDMVFGDLEEAAKTDKNPRIALLRAKNAGLPLPRLYMSCGMQDSLLGSNRSLREFFLENGVSVTYRESDGQHNWDFWNAEIQALLEWLPLPQPNAGLSSGNVSAK